jgi:hypothetical protein
MKLSGGYTFCSRKGGFKVVMFLDSSRFDIAVVDTAAEAEELYRSSESLAKHLLDPASQPLPEMNVFLARFYRSLKAFLNSL